MSSLIERLKILTRWDTIPNTVDGYRLLCNNSECSLSCANLKDGKLSITSVHGNERHSYTLTKRDMTFLGLLFLDSLEEKDLDVFSKLFNKISDEFSLEIEKF